MFHKHNYKEIARTYMPPHGLPAMQGRGLQEIIERGVSGQTTILWECEICQKLRKEELLGKIV